MSTPPTATEIEQIRKRHGPQKPGHCAGGFKITCDEACKTCGADDNHTCGRWVGYATEDIPALLDYCTTKDREIAEARAEAATHVRHTRGEWHGLILDWMNKAPIGPTFAEHVAKRLAEYFQQRRPLATALLSEHEALKKNQRTPGTVAVCEHQLFTRDDQYPRECYTEASTCKFEDCPLKAALRASEGG